MQSFNVVGQGPFSVMIEDISSRNGLLPLSNVHLLSVTDLLQREECCCYKREDQLKKNVTDLVTSNEQLQALTIADCVQILRALKFSAREPHVFLLELLIVITLQHLSSSEALSLCCGLRISLERTASIFLLCCIFLVLSEPLFSVFLLSQAHQFPSVIFLSSLLFLHQNTGTVSVKRLGW